jgi:hypothetical protein
VLSKPAAGLGADLLADGPDGGVHLGREALLENEPSGLDAPKAVAHRRHLGMSEADPAEALREAELVSGAVALGDGEELLVGEAVHRSRGRAADEGVHEPDVGLAVPQGGEPEGVGVALDRAQAVGSRPEAAGDGEAGAVVRHKVVAEADDEDPARGYLSRTTCTEQEMHGS